MKILKSFVIFCVMAMAFVATAVMAYSSVTVEQKNGTKVKYICCSCQKMDGGYWWQNQWVKGRTCQSACGGGNAESSKACTKDSQIFGYPAGQKHHLIEYNN